MTPRKGATIWARQTIESDIFFWKPDKWFKIWFFLVNEANYADTKQFKRGECFITYSEIMQATKATKDQVDKFMRWIKNQGMATTRKTTRGMVIKLCKYSQFQDSIKVKSDTPDVSKAKQKRNKSDTIQKNTKKTKQRNNNNNTLQPAAADDSPVQQIMAMFYERINPHLNFGNTTERKATQELLKVMGMEKLTEIIEYVVATQGKDRYFPSVTSPYELKTKLAKIKVYYESHNQSTVTVV